MTTCISEVPYLEEKNFKPKILVAFGLFKVCSLSMQTNLV